MINLRSSPDLQSALPRLLPKAIAWAEREARAIHTAGRPLDETELRIARAVEVRHPDQIRIALVPAIPLPDDPALRAAARELLPSEPDGLTLGYGLYLRRRITAQLLAHECRHVHQYERAGSIAAFLEDYLQQLVTFQYGNAPYEIDARDWSRTYPSE